MAITLRTILRRNTPSSPQPNASLISSTFPVATPPSATLRYAAASVTLSECRSIAQRAALSHQVRSGALDLSNLVRLLILLPKPTTSPLCRICSTNLVVPGLPTLPMTNLPTMVETLVVTSRPLPQPAAARATVRVLQICRTAAARVPAKDTALPELEIGSN